MELSPKQQIAELIKNNKRILVVGHKNLGGDLLGSMLAFERVLQKYDKEVVLVSSENIEQNLLFLPGVDKVKKDVSGQRDLVIQINKKSNPVEKISYTEEDDVISVVISPAGKPLDAKNLTFVQGKFKFDLIFVLDTPDVEKIDSVYDKYTELFFETPIVNIDHHSGNEYFGTVNLVDMTATSTAEVLVSIIEAMGPGNFDAEVATCLLTGIIADTASFKNTNTTPKSLTISAQMLAAGARQQEIIQNLYKTRPIQTLKLWGKVLSSLEYDKEHRIVYSFVTKEDLADSNASIESIDSVLDELLASAPGTDVVLVLAEDNNKLVGRLKGLNGQEVLAIAQAFGGHGQALSAHFELVNSTLENSKQKVVGKLIELRDSQLGRKETTAKTDIENVPRKNQEIVKEHRDIVIEQPATEKIDPKVLEDVIVDVTLEANSVDDLGELLSIEKVVEGAEAVEDDKDKSDPSYEEIFWSNVSEDKKPHAETAKSSDDAIEKAIESIDNEIESAPLPPDEDTPSIDIEDVKDKKDALRQIGEVMKGYTPGKHLDEKGNQPIDPQIWK